LAIAPDSWPLLAAAGLALPLGLKHGLDADHIAAIDGLARVHARAGRTRLAQCAGACFSVGHAGVVAAAAVAVARVGAWPLPAWLEAFGTGLSIGCLLLVGLLNLAAAARGGRPPLGLRSRLFGGASSGGGWFGAVSLGALFAVSLDTLALAAGFGVAGSQVAGIAGVLVLAVAFGAGMTLSDGLNGWWLNRLVRRCGNGSSAAATASSTIVGAVALSTAAFGLARAASMPFAAASEGRAWLLGMVLIAFTTLSLGWLGLARPGAARAAIVGAAGRGPDAQAVRTTSLSRSARKS
jgi:high-affinity nickel-transport protein